MFESYGSTRLSSPNHPIAIVDARFCCPQEVTLIMKEKLFTYSGDSYDIKDDAGRAWFKVRGKAFSMREKKMIYDVQGNPVINLKENMFSFLGRPIQKVYLGDNSTNLICTIKPRFKLWSGKLVTQGKNQINGHDLEFTLRSNHRGSEACIWLGKSRDGLPIAKIYRSLNMKSIMTDSRDYRLTVAPNVDVAFIVALAISLDELKKD